MKFEGESDSDSENEDEKLGIESRASTPEKGKPTCDDEDMETPPGPSRGRDHFYGFVFGSADAITLPKGIKSGYSYYSPTSSVEEEPSPDKGRPICSCSPRTPDREPMHPETDLLGLFDGGCESQGKCSASERESIIKQQLCEIPGGVCTAADYFAGIHSWFGRQTWSISRMPNVR